MDRNGRPRSWICQGQFVLADRPQPRITWLPNDCPPALVTDAEKRGRFAVKLKHMLLEIPSNTSRQNHGIYNYTSIVGKPYPGTFFLPDSEDAWFNLVSLLHQVGSHEHGILTQIRQGICPFYIDIDLCHDDVYLDMFHVAQGTEEESISTLHPNSMMAVVQKCVRDHLQASGLSAELGNCVILSACGDAKLQKKTSFRIIYQNMWLDKDEAAKLCIHIRETCSAFFAQETCLGESYIKVFDPAVYNDGMGNRILGSDKGKKTMCCPCKGLGKFREPQCNNPNGLTRCRITFGNRPWKCYMRLNYDGTIDTRPQSFRQFVIDTSVRDLSNRMMKPAKIRLTGCCIFTFSSSGSSSGSSSSLAAKASPSHGGLRLSTAFSNAHHPTVATDTKLASLIKSTLALTTTLKKPSSSASSSSSSSSSPSSPSSSPSSASSQTNEPCRIIEYGDSRIFTAIPLAPSLSLLPAPHTTKELKKFFSYVHAFCKPYLGPKCEFREHSVRWSLRHVPVFVIVCKAKSSACPLRSLACGSPFIHKHNTLRIHISQRYIWFRCMHSSCNEVPFKIRTDVDTHAFFGIAPDTTTTTTTTTTAADTAMAVE
jgi:hypothetical protein